ncbi:MAG: Ig-like domain-containing protein, partial [bacterium]
FAITFVQNGGTATNASIGSLTNNSDGALSGGESVVRCVLNLTGTPSGTETVEIKPVADSIYDAVGNAAANTQTTNAITLNDQRAPTVESVSSTKDDGSYGVGVAIPITVTFDETMTVTGMPTMELSFDSGSKWAQYTAGTGTVTLTFVYTTEAGDNTADLDYASNYAINLNGGTIKDAAGNASLLELPTMGEAGSLGANKAIVVDTASPTIDLGVVAPDNSSVVLVLNEGVYNTENGSGALDINDFSITFTRNGGSATNATIGSLDDCFGGGLAGGESMVDANLSITGTPSGVETVEIKAVADSIYDVVGNAMANTQTTNALTLADQQSPSVTNVTSTKDNGAYTINEVIGITVTFDEAVDVVTTGGTPAITLETGSTDRTATYATGTGTATLTFNYTVQAGDTSSDLDYTATNALQLTGGTIKDASGNNATLTLSLPLQSGSLSANKAIVIDTTAPTTPTNNAPADESSTGDNTPILTWEASTDVGGSGVVSYEVTIGATVATQGATTSYTCDALTDATHSWQVRAKDLAGNWSSKSTAFDLTVDTAGPDVTNVTSTKDDGSYAAGTLIPITVTFNESVTVVTSGGTPYIELETGDTDRQASYASGSPGTTLTFNYTVQAGDTSSDLDYTGTGALSVNGGTIKDGVANNANTAFVAPGQANSLGANKAIVIDTTAPSTPTNVTPADASTIADNTPTMTWEAATDTGGTGVVTYEVTLDGSLTTQGAIAVYTSEALADGAHTWQVRAKDSVGNWGSKSTAFSFTVDTTSPTGTGLTLSDRSSGSLVYTNELTVTVEASEISGSPTEMMLSESAVFAGASWASYANPTTFTLSSGDGTKTVYYKTRDAVLNVSDTLSDSIILDQTAPTAPTLLTPTNNTSTNETDPTFSWSAATDALSGIGSYEITINSPVIATTSATSYTPTSALNEGVHTWNVRAQDQAENWGAASTTYTVTIDATAPIVDLLTPAGGEVIPAIGPAYAITWTASDAIALATNPIALYYSIDAGTTWTAITTATANDGSHGWVVPETTTTARVKIVATDAAGNTATESSGSFNIDASVPTASIGTSVSGSDTSIVVTFSETMDTSSAEAAFSISPDVAGSFSWNDDNTVMTFTPTTGFTSGTTYTVVVSTSARNESGNPLSEEAEETITITSVSSDSTDPTVIIKVAGLAIANNDFINADTRFDVFLTDNVSLSASSIDLTIDGSSVAYSVASSTTTAMEIRYSATGLSVGTHVITAEVSDSSGNVTTKEVTGLHVSGEPPVATGVISVPMIGGASGAGAAASGGGATVAYTLNKNTNITFYMYGLSGEMVNTRKFTSGVVGAKAGYNQITVSGTSDISGAPLANGIYVFKLVSDGKVIGKGKIVVYN